VHERQRGVLAVTAAICANAASDRVRERLLVRDANALHCTRGV
jgi:hypothetical protein